MSLCPVLHQEISGLSQAALAGPAVFVSLSIGDRLAVIGDRNFNAPITDRRKPITASGL
jgi:hypothetical protein